VTAVEEAIHDRIVNTAPSGSKLGTRVYPMTLPQTPELPAATYQIVSVVPVHSHQGPSDLDATRIQIDTWADGYAAAREAAVAVRTVLDGIRGMVSGLWVGGVLYAGQSTHYEDEVDMWRVRADYRIWHATEVQ
jgi:hypothetical protein